MFKKSQATVVIISILLLLLPSRPPISWYSHFICFFIIRPRCVYSSSTLYGTYSEDESFVPLSGLSLDRFSLTMALAAE